MSLSSKKNSKRKISLSCTFLNELVALDLFKWEEGGLSIKPRHFFTPLLPARHTLVNGT